MKTHTPHARVTRLSLAAGLLLITCQSASALSSRASTSIPDLTASAVNLRQLETHTVAAPAATPAETLLAEIKGTPYSERAALQEKLKSGEARFAEKLPEWQAKKDALPSEKKSEAEAIFKQLVTDREVLRQKIEGVDNAQAETWNSAKSELYTALQNTISTYNRLKVIFES